MLSHSTSRKISRAGAVTKKPGAMAGLFVKFRQAYGQGCR